MLSPSRLVRAAALTAMGAVALVLPLTPPGTNAAVVSTVPPLTFLHVVTPPGGPDLTPYLADAAGRQVLLHGVAAVGMEDVAYPHANGGPALFPVSPSAYSGRCPKASALLPQPPLCETQAAKPAYQQSIAPASGDDFAQMRAIGFNVARLVLNWSQLEPHPGVYSATYLDRVAQVVGWARQQGIYLILDMHQDQYSRYILPADKASAPSGCSPSGGGDGAPGWAVQSDGKPGCALYGVDELNPAESAAFANFWQNSPVDGPQGRAPGTGLQDHFIGALASLADRFEHDPTVLGYELMNEPQPGSLGSLPAANGYQASSQELYPFYTRAVEALTGVRDGRPTCPASAPTSLSNSCAYPKLASVSRQQIFFEPLAYRNLLDFSLQVSKPFTEYPNIVFAPHVYTYAFTFEQDLLGLPAKPGGYPPNFELRVPDGRGRGASDALCGVRDRVRGLVEHRRHHLGRRAGGTGIDADRRHPVGLEGTCRPRAARAGAHAGSSRPTRRRRTARRARATRTRNPLRTTSSSRAGSESSCGCGRRRRPGVWAPTPTTRRRARS